jgi:branched-chain amino acid transport system substrate-binding protein
MGTIASYETEGTIYGKYILQSVKDAKIGVLYQNDDLGRDYFKGLQEGFGEQAKAAIVKAVSYELTDPTIDSQIINLKASGANVFFNASLARQDLPRRPFARPLILNGDRRIFFP